MTHSENKQDGEKFASADKTKELQSIGFWQLLSVGIQKFKYKLSVCTFESI